MQLLHHYHTRKLVLQQPPSRMRALGRSQARRCSEQQVQPSEHGGSRYQAHGTQGVAGFNSEHNKQVLMHTPSAGSWQAGLMAGRTRSYRVLLCPAICSTLLSLSCPTGPFSNPQQCTLLQIQPCQARILQLHRQHSWLL